MQMNNAQEIAALLLADITLQQEKLHLNLGRCTVTVRSNSLLLLSQLQDYFSHIILHAQDSVADITMMAIEAVDVDLSLDFYDWKREAGKSGRKESVCDIADARIIKKVRTGMYFLQSNDIRIAVGPCLENVNQIINFINNQYMTWLQQQHWLNCHASALVKDDKAYAIAGFSGGGKSTLMLQMLEDSTTQFLSNDRLFIQQEGAQLQAIGIAKMPRINPGTIIHNPRLAHMIPQSERDRLLAMSPQDLWDLEQKYDVDINAIYGEGRIIGEAPLQSFLVLNWQHNAATPLKLRKVRLRERPDLLQAIMKSPGPFYQYKNGQFSKDTYLFDQEAYLKVLDLIDVFEATGRVDFPILAAHYVMQKEI